MRLIPTIKSVGVVELNTTIAQINAAIKELAQLSGRSQQVSAPADNMLVYDKTVGVDADLGGRQLTSVTIDNLDGNTHGGYEFEFISYGNNVAGNTNIYFNNDTTAANYRSGRHRVNMGSGAVTTGFGSDAILYTVSNIIDMVIVSGGIIQTPDGYLHLSWLGHVVLGGINYVYSGHIYKVAAVANLTRIDIIAPANGININSRFRLWRKK